MVDEPLADELLRQLALRLTLLEFLLITVSIEVTAGVRSVNLVDEIELTVTLAELILSVDEYKTALSSNLLTTCEKLTSPVLDDSIVLGTDNALLDNLLSLDIHVVTLISLCCRGDDWLREALVLTHSVRKFNTAELTASVLVGTPCATGKD